MGEEDELIQDFIVEAEEHLEDVEEKLMELEKNGADDELVNSVFRSFHTIKGNAKWLGFTKIIDLSHATEFLLGDLRSKKLSLSPVIVDLILQSRDILQQCIDQVKLGEQPEADIDELISHITKERS